MYWIVVDGQNGDPDVVDGGVGKQPSVPIIRNVKNTIDSLICPLCQSQLQPIASNRDG